MSSLAETLADQVARQQEEIEALRARLERVDPRPATPADVDVEVHLKRALKLNNNDPEKAASLFLAWCDQDSDTRKALKPIIREALDRRLLQILAATQEGS